MVALLNQKVAQILAEPEFRRLAELGGVSPTSGNTVEAFNQVVQRSWLCCRRRRWSWG